MNLNLYFGKLSEIKATLSAGVLRKKFIRSNYEITPFLDHVSRRYIFRCGSISIIKDLFNHSIFNIATCDATGTRSASLHNISSLNLIQGVH